MLCCSNTNAIIMLMSCTSFDASVWRLAVIYGLMRNFFMFGQWLVFRASERQTKSSFISTACHPVQTVNDANFIKYETHAEDNSVINQIKFCSHL